MGNVYGASKAESPIDPQFGFQAARVERKCNVTADQMVSAKLPLKDRDYCAQELLQYRGCRSDVFPFVYKCHHERHEYLNCEYKDYVLRMKEFERQQRLRRN